jgi:flagellar basal body rod protein FlgF
LRESNQLASNRWKLGIEAIRLVQLKFVTAVAKYQNKDGHTFSNGHLDYSHRNFDVLKLEHGLHTLEEH